VNQLLLDGRRSLRRYSAAAVRTAAAAADSAVRPKPGVVILAYHRIGAGTDSLVDVPTALFRRQMSHLSQNHKTVSLDAALTLLREQSQEPVVAITFDDGTSDFIDNALPILEEFDLPASIYLATSFANELKPFPWGAAPLSWNAVSEATSTGLISIEAHTHGHLVMDKFTQAQAKEDLEICDALIADNTGRPPKHFAYPKGVIGSPPVEILVRERYLSAAGARVGTNRVGQDLHRLLRSPIQSVDEDKWFARKALGGLALEGHLREAANRFRYRRSTS